MLSNLQAGFMILYFLSKKLNNIPLVDLDSSEIFHDYD